MSVKPIIFSTPMVKALLEGNKNITRRVIKPQPKCRLSYIYAGANNGKWNYPSRAAVEDWGEAYRQPKHLTKADRNALWTPPCHTGDILWVREAWAMYLDYKTGEPARKYVYRADGGMAYALLTKRTPMDGPLPYRLCRGVRPSICRKRRRGFFFTLPR